jgi:hypothetical protein
VLGRFFIRGDRVDAERAGARVGRGDGMVDEIAVDLGAAVLPNGCGMLVRALGTTASQVRGTLLKIWGVLAD